MKSSLLIAAAMCAIALSGCTGMEEKSAYVAPKSVQYPNAVRVESDAAYIAAVERIARRRGITLQWVNMPTKRIATAEQ